MGRRVTLLICTVLAGGSCTFDVIPEPPIYSGNPPDGYSVPDDGALGDDLAPGSDLSSSASPDLAPLPGNVGDACSGQCANGLTCMNWVANGYCSSPCGGSSPACQAGSSCVDIGMGNRFCLLNDSGSCARPDLTCRDCGQNVCGPPSFCAGC
jgi:hypothetical protein